MKQYELHTLATIFPALGAEALNELAADIKANGLRDSITTLAGAILDGRNRASACHAAGIEPRFEEWTPRFEGDTPERFVFSRNVARRHLTDAQRGVIAARFVTNALGGVADGVTVKQAADALGVKPSRVYTERERIRNGGLLNVELKHGKTNPSYVPKAAAPAAAPKGSNVVAIPRAPHATGAHVKADIVAFLQANEKRDTTAIDKAERIELALRFVKMLSCGDVIVRKSEAKAAAPARRLGRIDHIGPELRRQLEGPKPADTDVEAFLARGGTIERCPTAAATATHGIKLSPEDIAALAEHDAQRDAEWRAKTTSEKLTQSSAP